MDTPQDAYMPIAQLNPSQNTSVAKIRGIVTLIWPYSASRQTFSLLLVEPDFRLRRYRGQVRITFKRSCARALARANIASGDNLQVHLAGCGWVAEDTTVHTPGKSVDWELTFTRHVRVEIERRNRESQIVEADATECSPESRPLLSTSTPRALAKNAHADAVSGLGFSGSWSTPVYLKKRDFQRTIHGGSYDIFAEDDALLERHSKRTRFGRGSHQWRFAARTPSPQFEVSDREGLGSDQPRIIEPVSPTGGQSQAQVIRTISTLPSSPGQIGEASITAAKSNATTEQAVSMVNSVEDRGLGFTSHDLDQVTFEREPGYIDVSSSQISASQLPPISPVRTQSTFITQSKNSSLSSSFVNDTNVIEPSSQTVSDQTASIISQGQSKYSDMNCSVDVDVEKDVQHKESPRLHNLQDQTRANEHDIQHTDTADANSQRPDFPTLYSDVTFQMQSAENASFPVHDDLTMSPVPGFDFSAPGSIANRDSAFSGPVGQEQRDTYESSFFNFESYSELEPSKSAQHSLPSGVKAVEQEHRSKGHDEALKGLAEAEHGHPHQQGIRSVASGGSDDESEEYGTTEIERGTSRSASLRFGHSIPETPTYPSAPSEDQGAQQEKAIGAYHTVPKDNEIQMDNLQDIDSDEASETQDTPEHVSSASDMYHASGMHEGAPIAVPADSRVLDFKVIERRFGDDSENESDEEAIQNEEGKDDHHAQHQKQSESQIEQGAEPSQPFEGSEDDTDRVDTEVPGKQGLEAMSEYESDIEVVEQYELSCQESVSVEKDVTELQALPIQVDQSDRFEEQESEEQDEQEDVPFHEDAGQSQTAGMNLATKANALGVAEDDQIKPDVSQVGRKSKPIFPAEDSSENRVSSVSPLPNPIKDRLGRKVVEMDILTDIQHDASVITAIEELGNQSSANGEHESMAESLPLDPNGTMSVRSEPTVNQFKLSKETSSSLDGHMTPVNQSSGSYMTTSKPQISASPPTPSAEPIASSIGVAKDTMPATPEATAVTPVAAHKIPHDPGLNQQTTAQGTNEPLSGSQDVDDQDLRRSQRSSVLNRFKPFRESFLGLHTAFESSTINSGANYEHQQLEEIRAINSQSIQHGQETTDDGKSDTSKPDPVSQQLLHEVEQAHSEEIVQPLAKGARTKHGYYTPLANLQQHFKTPVDVLATIVATTAPERALKGPRDWHMTLYVTDLSMVEATFPLRTVQIFRPAKSALPTNANADDVILLHSFQCQSQKRRPMLLSRASSGWMVFDKNRQARVAGPPVEYGEEEVELSQTLHRWWDNMSAHEKMRLRTNAMTARESARQRSGRRSLPAPGTMTHELRDGFIYPYTDTPLISVDADVDADAVTHELRDGTLYQNRDN